MWSVIILLVACTAAFVFGWRSHATVSNIRLEYEEFIYEKVLSALESSDPDYVMAIIKLNSKALISDHDFKEHLDALAEHYADLIIALATEEDEEPLEKEDDIKTIEELVVTASEN